jgi:hypothetical protein
MTKNLYFRTVIKRESIIQKVILNFFHKTASFPRLILEVFIRKNFGIRYFNIASVLTVAFILALLPVMLYNLSTETLYTGRTFFGFAKKYATWYAFLSMFLYHSWQRWKEIRRGASSFDFTKFSLYAGDVNPWFHTIRLLKKSPTIRRIETLYEPGIFFLGGALLCLFGQSIGLLLCISSVFYSLSYVSTYWQGDNFVLDRIDETIFNEEMIRAFVDDIGTDCTRGVRFYANKPSAKVLRKKVADTMQERGPHDAADVR